MWMIVYFIPKLVSLSQKKLNSQTKGQMISPYLVRHLYVQLWKTLSNLIRTIFNILKP